MKLRTLIVTSTSLMLVIAAVSLPAAERVALVIGNDAYKVAQPLKNAVSDARSVAERLKQTTFEVLLVEDATAEKMHESLEKFQDMARGCSVGLVFYSGHGLEEDGKNYLVPVDATLERKAQIPLQTLSLAQVLEAMKEARVPAKIVLLDSCRNMPLTRSWRTTRGSSGGLAGLDTKEMPESTLVYYSTAPGQVALDEGSSGKHSPFTQALLDTMNKPGIHALEALMQVEDSVHEQTSGQQRPKLFSDGETSPFRKFSFMTGVVPVTVMAKASPTMPAPPPPPAAAVVPPVTVPTTPPSPAMPADLPSSGYFSLDEVFQGGSYASYNKYSRGLILKKAQEKLKVAGLYSSSADGVMGKGSQRAVLLYQQQHAFPVSGRLDGKTLSALGITDIAESVEPPPPTSEPVVTTTGGTNGVLRAGDSISFSIAEDRRAAVTLSVAINGTVEVPYIGVVQAAGFTHEQFAAVVKKELERSYFNRATVSVSSAARVRQAVPSPTSTSGYFTVFGQVNKQGKYELRSSVSLSQAILMAGGFSQFARTTKVKLVRKTAAGNVTSTVDVDAILKKGDLKRDVQLQPNDVIIVEEKTFNF